MPHNLCTNYSHATPLLEAIQRNLLGSFRALLGRNCNAGNAGDATNACTSDPCIGGGCAFAIALAFALACSTKGANSFSNSELDHYLIYLCPNHVLSLLFYSVLIVQHNASKL
jgi:hypothetical protein